MGVFTDHYFHFQKNTGIEQALLCQREERSIHKFTGILGAVYLSERYLGIERW